jgi:hypothetical protein
MISTGHGWRGLHRRRLAPPSAQGAGVPRPAAVATTADSTPSQAREDHQPRNSATPPADKPRL